MKNFTWIFAFLLAACGDISVVDIVVVDLPSSQNLITVEGWVTDVNEHQYVRLTRTNGFSANDPVMTIVDANVVVQSRDGETFLYTHFKDGFYRSNDLFSGLIGKEYRVRVLLSDNQEIQSDWEEMPSVVALDSLFVSSFVENDPEDPSNQITVFFPETEAMDPPETSNYYRWIFYRNDEKYVEPESITIQDDRFFNGNLIPNNFQSFGYEEGDTIIVQFQSIQKETYDYLSLLKSQITSLGTSSGTTPAIVNGNLAYFSSDQSEQVLGYFGVAAVSSDTVVVE